MNPKVLKSTSKGQITLPKDWRDRFQTDNYLIESKGNYAIIKPIRIEEIESEEILFDADRDNHGRGISPEEMISMLKKARS